LLRDPKTINAFALPGGQIFITRGLYSKLTNEAQLAGVLGHEIGHVIHRHGAEHMASTQLGNALVTAVGVGASDDRGHGVTAQMAAAMANQMLQLKYSRGDELESDQFGLVAMVSAGLDPKSMLKVMEILQEASKGRSGAQIFATHPDPEARMVAIRAFLDKNYPNGTPSNLTPGRPLQSAEAEFQSNWRSPASKFDRALARDTRRPAASYELHP
jgi:predicted Zn-dependent protease